MMVETVRDTRSQRLLYVHLISRRRLVLEYRELTSLRSQVLGALLDGESNTVFYAVQNRGGRSYGPQYQRMVQFMARVAEMNPEVLVRFPGTGPRSTRYRILPPGPEERAWLAVLALQER